MTVDTTPDVGDECTLFGSEGVVTKVNALSGGHVEVTVVLKDKDSSQVVSVPQLVSGSAADKRAREEDKAAEEESTKDDEADEEELDEEEPEVPAWRREL